MPAHPARPAAGGLTERPIAGDPEGPGAPPGGRSRIPERLVVTADGRVLIVAEPFGASHGVPDVSGWSLAHRRVSAARFAGERHAAPRLGRRRVVVVGATPPLRGGPAIPRLVRSAALLGVLLLPVAAHAQYACEQWAPFPTFNANPVKRFGEGMVYENDRKKILMFGGQTQGPLGVPEFLADTWELDLDTATWTPVGGATVPDQMPDPSLGMAMAYDSDRHVAYRYGGLAATGFGFDGYVSFSWTYTPATEAWVETDVLDTGNVGIDQAAMAYDPIRKVAVVFGGRDADHVYDTTLVGRGAFARVLPAHHPAARYGHTMVWSPTLGGVILYGGTDALGNGFATQFNDVWLWDGTDWTDIGTGFSIDGHGAVWDTVYDKMIVFGGEYTSPTADVSFRTGTIPGTFAVHPTTGGPEARTRIGFVWDEAHHVAVLFGGENGDTLFDGVWTFGGRVPTITTEPLSMHTPPCHDDFFSVLADGFGQLRYHWQRLVNGTPIDLADNARMHGMETTQMEINPTRPDDAGQYRVEVSNECGATDSLPFGILVDEGSWQQGSVGPPRVNAPMAYDSGRGKMVLFGGFQTPADEGIDFATEQDTWEYDGVHWSQVAKLTPVPGRQYAGMAYDPVRAVTVLYGGTYADGNHDQDRDLADTWEWNGTAWTQKADGPGARLKHGMVWDSERQRIEVYGGRVGLSAANDLWEWDGTSWTPRTTVGGPPPANELQSVAYDDARHALVVHTLAHAANGFVGQTWDLIDGQWFVGPSSAESALANGDFVIRYDAGRGKVIGVGLHTNQNDPLAVETWERSAPDAWRLMQVFEPTARDGFALAYDSGRHRMVMQGGSVVGVGPTAETEELVFAPDPLCGVTVCGDGAVDPTEDCDPFTNDPVGCCSGCAFLPFGFPCELGVSGHCNAAHACSTEACGNGARDPGEDCDPTFDGNECCTTSCTFVTAGTTCGSGQGACDDSGQCVSTTCRNGTIDSPLEQCDGTDHAAAGCCTPACRFDFGACGDPCRGDFCSVIGPTEGAGCFHGPLGASGCMPGSSAVGYLGADGGTLETPDGSAKLVVPPGVGPATGYGVAAGYDTAGFALAAGAILVADARLLPAGTTFAPPGATIALRWHDEDGDGLVDVINADERQLKLYHDGVLVSTCGTDPGCDRTANTWTFATLSFSEFTLAGPPAAPCATFDKPKLVLGKILAPAGDDTLTFGGTMPAPMSPPDPDLGGFSVRLDDGSGTVLDVTLPPGAYGKATKTGWKVDKKRTHWTWSHPKTAAPAGIVKATVAVKKGVLTVGVKGGPGSFAATAPLTMTIRFPPTESCGATSFDVADEACVVKSKGKKLVCK